MHTDHRQVTWQEGQYSGQNSVTSVALSIQYLMLNIAVNVAQNVFRSEQECIEIVYNPLDWLHKLF